MYQYLIVAQKDASGAESLSRHLQSAQTPVDLGGVGADLKPFSIVDVEASNVAAVIAVSGLADFAETPPLEVEHALAQFCGIDTSMDYLMTPNLSDVSTPNWNHISDLYIRLSTRLTNTMANLATTRPTLSLPSPSDAGTNAKAPYFETQTVTIAVDKGPNIEVKVQDPSELTVKKVIGHADIFENLGSAKVLKNKFLEAAAHSRGESAADNAISAPKGRVFLGPAGIGKTTVADAYAQALATAYSKPVIELDIMEVTKANHYLQTAGVITKRAIEIAREHGAVLNLGDLGSITGGPNDHRAREIIGALVDSIPETDDIDAVPVVATGYPNLSTIIRGINLGASRRLNFTTLEAPTPNALALIFEQKLDELNLSISRSALKDVENFFAAQKKTQADRFDHGGFVELVRDSVVERMSQRYELETANQGESSDDLFTVTSKDIPATRRNGVFEYAESLSPAQTVSQAPARDKVTYLPGAEPEREPGNSQG